MARSLKCQAELLKRARQTEIDGGMAGWISAEIAEIAALAKEVGELRQERAPERALSPRHAGRAAHSYVLGGLA